MTKSSGLGARFYVGGYDLSGDTQAVDSISGGPKTLPGTDITMSAEARLFGQRDGSMQWTSYFDKTGAHVLLSTLPRTDEVMTFVAPPVQVQAAAACLNAKQINYDGSRGSDGSLMLKVQGVANGFGLEWGEMLTAGLRTDTTATTGAAVTDAGATSFGAQAYLQLVAFSGTSVDVTITHATSSGGSYSTLIDFGAQTAIGSFRQSVSNATTVNQFLKVVTAGTFTNAVFAVMFMRNLTTNVVF